MKLLSSQQAWCATTDINGMQLLSGKPDERMPPKESRHKVGKPVPRRIVPRDMRHLMCQDHGLLRGVETMSEVGRHTNAWTENPERYRCENRLALAHTHCSPDTQMTRDLFYALTDGIRRLTRAKGLSEEALIADLRATKPARRRR